MRLDKYLADNSSYSRSQVKKLIKNKRVTLAGALCTDSTQKVASNQTDICIDGIAITAQLPRYLLLNKPKGFICSTVDESSPSVLRLFPAEYADLKIVGRLDVDTTGLLLLTDDGQWLHRVSNPNRSHGKTYLVTTDRDITAEQLTPMTMGVALRGDEALTKPARVEYLSKTQFKLTIFEGRYHQVKRMCAALGFYVAELHRTAIGDIHLPSDVDGGTWRNLTANEVANF